MVHKLSNKALDQIIEEMINVVSNSKNEIFHLSEEARCEYEHLATELTETRKKVREHIETGDQLERKLKQSKKQLVLVSRDFNSYSEEDIRIVYDQTSKLQASLITYRYEEKLLRNRRDELERRLQSLSEMIERAEVLVGKIAIVLNYLLKDFQQVGELIENAKEKQEFGLKIIEAQEEERRKISREIHDGPAQTLANILLRSEIVDKTFRTGDFKEALNEIHQMRELIRSSLYEVRRIIYDLRPMALDDLGLVPTIRKYVNTISEYEDLPIDFTLIGKEKRLSSDYEVACFRLIQEALQNAIKHAQASRIKVKMEIRADSVNIIVSDDGRGFDIDQRKDKTFGIMGMRERVEALEGELNIRSTVGKGTTVSFHIPIVKKSSFNE